MMKEKKQEAIESELQKRGTDKENQESARKLRLSETG